MKENILAIKSNRVWLGDGYEPAVILTDISSGRIAEVLRGNVVPMHCGEELSLLNTYILPGLIDCHTHAGMDGPGGDLCGDRNDPAHFVTPFFRAVDAADPFQESFQRAGKAGITTVCVLPGSGCAVGGQAGVMVTGAADPFRYILRENVGMKVALGTQPRKTADEANVSPMTKMALYAMIKESFRAAKSRAADGEAGEEASGRDLAWEGWEPVLSGRAPIRVHCHREDDIAKMIRFADAEGVKIVLEHGSQALRLAEALIERDIPVVCTDTVFRVPQYLEEECASPELPSALMKRGVRVALSTNFPEASWDALLVQAGNCIKNGVPYKQVIESMTCVPAQILGMEDELGTIDSGKWADLSFWSGALSDFQTMPLGVMIHGELRAEKGLL